MSSIGTGSQASGAAIVQAMEGSLGTQKCRHEALVPLQSLR